MEYLFKSAACLLVLLLVHQLFLQQEVMHRFNRVYLLSAIVVSFLIPILTIEVAEDLIPTAEVIPEQVVLSQNATKFTSENPVQFDKGESPFDWEFLLIGIYSLISFLFLIRFLRNIHVLVNQIQRNIKIEYRGQTLVLLPEETLPFSFLKYIFISKNIFDNQGISEPVFLHESTHVNEKHSWDILFVEALLIPLWFHPGLYWARESIKLNHEFIADEVALRSTSLEKYESQLLTMLLSDHKFDLASSLNFSLTKKRFEMMKKKSMTSKSWVKIVVLIPVVGMLIYFFSERVTAKVDNQIVSSEVFMNASLSEGEDFDFTFTLDPSGMILFENEKYDLEAVKAMIFERKAVSDDLKINLITSSALSMGELSDFQAILRDLDIRKVHYVSLDERRGSTPAEIVESQVDQLGQKANNQDDEKAKFYGKARFLVETEQMEYIEKTYSQLTSQQRDRLLTLTEAPQKKKPDPAQFNKWKNKDEFALWLDGKVISNEKLNEIASSEIVHFFSSKVYNNARSERFPQPFQVHLYSAPYYEETYGSNAGIWKPIEGTITITPRATWMRDLSKNPDKTTEYLQLFYNYEKLRTSGVNYINKSEQEQEKLDAMFSDLDEKYFKFNTAAQSKIKRAEVPFAPYMKLKKDGEVYYKLQKDLTEDEKNNHLLQ